MIFSTDRLLVREFELSDLDNFYIMQSDYRVMQYIKPELTLEESKAELEKFIRYYSDEIFYKLWAITTADENEFVGMCGVYLNQQGEYEIAYRLTYCAWGNGYGNEVAKDLFSYCLDQLQLPKIVGYAYVTNLSSIKILEKYMDFVEESVHEETGIMGRKYQLELSQTKGKVTL